MEDTAQKTNTLNPKPFPNYPLAELHAHLSTSISPEVLWQIAHDSGFKLPKKDYIEFEQFVQLSDKRRMPLNEYFKKIYTPILHPLSSGVHAVEQGAYHTIAGAYRRNGTTLMELRFNPMKHNGHNSIDLDHIIMAMLRGMERVLLAYPQLSAGLILSMDRTFPLEQNAIIIDKAIKYHRRGVVGIDVSGPGDPGFHFKDYTAVFNKARKAGLKVTVHAGEQRDANDIWDALEHVQPARIGHGILAAYDKPLMKKLAKQGTVLEVCPLSNLATEAVENIDELKFILRAFVENKVRLTINTDWPEIIEDCQLQKQYAFLLDKDILSEGELSECTRTAFEASFIPKPGGLDAYL
ncbi:MAG: adenosine deaminase [Candidatus Saccharimonadales bacterium]